MTSILQKIITHKKKEIEDLPQRLKKIAQKRTLVASVRNFEAALQKKNQNYFPNLIAEIKQASPSKGEIFPQAPIESISQIYEKNGAACISCLTDFHFFGGSLEILESVVKNTTIPLLRKDFILNEYQIEEARYFGADAILLMVSVLQDERYIQKLIEVAEELKMSVLVEADNAETLKKAIDSGAKIIGINARNFTDLSVDKTKFQKLLPQIPEGIIRVSESGFQTPLEIEKIKDLTDGVLVGSHFMELKNLEKIATSVQGFSGKNIGTSSSNSPIES